MLYVFSINQVKLVIQKSKTTVILGRMEYIAAAGPAPSPWRPPRQRGCGRRWSCSLQGHR